MVFMKRRKWTAAEWFAEAERCYVEQHQGCAWCGGSYRVFQSHHGMQTEYCCNSCDFRVVRDAAANSCSSYPGEDLTNPKRETMLEL